MHWEELPTALYPGEGDEPDASGVWTGSVIYGEGKYHAFYTGYCLTAEYQQTICHATSEDGITWTKDAANPVITPMIELYEKLDWRDPYVFYNEEDKCYWILISARRLDMPVTRRGCIVLYRSKDLVNWEYYGPLYSAGNTNCPECSEMYKIGDTWYLSYSRFSEFVNTIYRTSKSPFGPWKSRRKTASADAASMQLNPCRMITGAVSTLPGRMTVQKTATAASGTGAARSVFRMRSLQRQTDSWM